MSQYNEVFPYKKLNKGDSSWKLEISETESLRGSSNIAYAVPDTKPLYVLIKGENENNSSNIGGFDATRIDKSDEEFTGVDFVVNKILSDFTKRDEKEQFPSQKVVYNLWGKDKPSYNSNSTIIRYGPAGNINEPSHSVENLEEPGVLIDPLVDTDFVLKTNEIKYERTPEQDRKGAEFFKKMQE